MSKRKSSADITATADELHTKLAALRREARKLKQLEKQREAEAKRQADIAFALEFVEYTKRVHFKDCDISCFEMLEDSMRLEKTKATNQ